MQRDQAVPSERVPSGPNPAGCLSAGTGKLLPQLTLATPSGSAFAIGQYSARWNLVIVLLGAGAPGELLARLIAQLAQAHVALDDEDARVLVIGTGDAGGLSEEEAPSLTVLVDKDAAFHRGVGAVDATGRAAPALYITDRFREIYHVARPGDAQWPTSIDEVLSWLSFMNIQCPECGAPEW